MKIYVITHKFDGNLLSLDSLIYQPLLVGSYNKSHDNLQYLYDDRGDNISNKNSNYCELTGLYWMRKNSSEDILGLCHYRRFFSKSILYKNSKSFVNDKQLKKIFKSYDVVLPKKEYWTNSNYEELKDCWDPRVFSCLENAIKTLYPDYLKSYHDILNSNINIFYNMIITKKEILNSYCEWLFDILFFVEERLDVDAYSQSSYMMRIFGFLSERLLFVWITKNNLSLKIKYLNVIKTDDSNLSRIKHSVKNFLVKNRIIR